MRLQIFSKAVPGVTIDCEPELVLADLTEAWKVSDHGDIERTPLIEHPRVHSEAVSEIDACGTGAPK